MIVLVLAICAGVLSALGLYFGDVAGWGWSICGGVTVFVVAQGTGGYILQTKVKAAMARVQEILAGGQKKLEAKTRRWQLRPPSSQQAAQNEIMQEQRIFVAQALEETEKLHRFDKWVPLMKRQIATAQYQLNWMIRAFKKVDALEKQAIFMDPAMVAMKMSRMYLRNETSAEIEKVYAKATRRLRYNQNVLLAGLWSWILVQRKDADGAFKALTEALKNSDNATLKSNHEHLMNNRVGQFSNSGLGDQWYALALEEPKIRHERKRMQWR